MSESLSGKYSLKLLDHAKQSGPDAFKTNLKIIIKKTAEITGDLIGNKIADRITAASKTSAQNSLEMIMIKKTYLQKKGRNLLMKWDWYNSMIMEYQIIINLLGNTPN